MKSLVIRLAKFKEKYKNSFTFDFSRDYIFSIKMEQ